MSQPRAHSADGPSRTTKEHIEHRSVQALGTGPRSYRATFTVPGNAPMARATLADGDLEPGAIHAFALSLPPGAPPGVRSTHGALGWEVEAHADRRGPDAREAQAFVVGPTDTV